MDRKMILAVLLALIIISAGAFIVLNTGGNETAGPVTLIDAEGRNVTTSQAPLRIVSCSPSLTEIVYAIGMGERLVSVTDYCNWPEDVNVRKANGSMSSIGGYFTPSIEAIVEADSDIILVDQGVQAQLDMLPQMEDLQLNAIVLHKGLTFEEVYENIAMIGEICWEDQKADQLINSLNGRLSDIQETIGEVDEKPTVAFAVWLEPLCVSGNGTFSHNMMNLAMGENAYSDLTGWPYDLSVESIIERDPDYLLVSLMWVPTTAEAVLQDLRNDTLWSETSAVQNNQVYVFTGQADNVFSRPGPRMVDGVELMAMILHGEDFNVTMPNVLADDYVEWISGSVSADAPAGVLDALGRSIGALDEGTTIVSVSPSLTELVYALELDDDLVGVSDNCNFPLDVLDRKEDGSLANIGKYNKPNVEAIANLTPGLVLLDAKVSGHMAILPQLEEMNITCLVLYQAKTVSNIYNNIELVGNVMGKQTLARETITEMAGTISMVNEKLEGRNADVNVMFSIYFSTSSIWVAGDDTFNTHAIELAGGQNVFTEVDGYFLVNTESVLAADPDVLLITDVMGKMNHTTIWEFLHTDLVWKEVNAVKNGQVYIMTGQAANIFDRPSVRVAQGVNLLGVLLYPELFGIEPLPSVIGDDYLIYL